MQALSARRLKMLKIKSIFMFLGLDPGLKGTSQVYMS